MKNPFAAKTVNSVLSAVYDAIDDLERISEQQEVIFDQREEQIVLLRSEQLAATEEGTRAEAVANKLRALVEV